MKPYHREIISYLQNEYGATNVQHWGGSNHPRLEFKYQDKPFTLTLNRDHTDRGLATNLKKQDIRRILGQPPEKETKQSRKLENMMPEPVPFNPALQIESLAKPPEIKQQTITEMGYVAIYITNNKNTMRFDIPKNILAKSNLGGKFYEIKSEGELIWKIFPAPSTILTRKKCSDTGQVSTVDYKNLNGLPPRMGRSLAEFSISTDPTTILVRLNEKNIKPVDEKHAAKITQGRKLAITKINNAHAAPSLVTDTPLIIPKTSAIDDLTKQLKSTLDTIHTIESTTPYRLMRNKETGNWLFSAPRIE